MSPHAGVSGGVQIQCGVQQKSNRSPLQIVNDSALMILLLPGTAGDNDEKIYKILYNLCRHYCVIENPVLRDDDEKIMLDGNGQAKLLHADQDIRLAQEPFPLYPGEVLKQPVSPLKVVAANSALRLRAILDFEDASGEKRVAGDEWLFEGPGEWLGFCP